MPSVYPPFFVLAHEPRDAVGERSPIGIERGREFPAACEYTLASSPAYAGCARSLAEMEYQRILRSHGRQAALEFEVKSSDCAQKRRGSALVARGLISARLHQNFNEGSLRDG
jgi:hypothetical protein